MLNAALHLPVKKPFDASTTDDKIKNIFRSLNYTGSLDDLGKLGRPFLRKSGPCSLIKIAKAFIGKCSGYDTITYITCQIGYNLLTNKVIDIANLLLQHMRKR